MTDVLMAFIHQHARSLEDEIARAEAAIRMLPDIDASTRGGAETRSLLRRLRERVEALKLLASLRVPDRSRHPGAIGALRRPDPPRRARRQPH
jgi:hypothetical protein